MTDANACERMLTDTNAYWQNRKQCINLKLFELFFNIGYPYVNIFKNIIKFCIAFGCTISYINIYSFNEQNEYQILIPLSTALILL